MPGEVYTFDLQSMQTIGEQMRFLTTRVRNLQSTVDKIDNSGGAEYGDRGRTQDQIVLVILGPGEFLKNSDPNMYADLPEDEGGGLPPYRTTGYSISAKASVLGFNRKNARKQLTDKTVRIFDPTGNSNLTAGDTAHVFWNRRSNHWEVVGSPSVSSPMVPLVLWEDAFITHGTDPRRYTRRKAIRASRNRIKFNGSLSSHEDIEDQGFLSTRMYDTSAWFSHETDDPDHEYSYVVDIHGTIPWAKEKSRGYGIEIPNLNIELAEDATDEAKVALAKTKFYYPVFFEQRAMWFGFTAPREISAGDRRVVVHESWMREWHSGRVQGGSASTSPGAQDGGLDPNIAWRIHDGEIASFRGESPKPFDAPSTNTGDVDGDENRTGTPDPTVAPGEDYEGYRRDRRHLLYTSTEVYNTFGFTVDQGAPCNAIWMGDRYVLIQARCPVGIKDPTHGSSFDTSQETYPAATGGGGISPGQQATGI